MAHAKLPRNSNQIETENPFEVLNLLPDDSGVARRRAVSPPAHDRVLPTSSPPVANPITISGEAAGSASSSSGKREAFSSGRETKRALSSPARVESETSYMQRLQKGTHEKCGKKAPSHISKVFSVIGKGMGFFAATRPIKIAGVVINTITTLLDHLAEHFDHEAGRGEYSVLVREIEALVEDDKQLRGVNYPLKPVVKNFNCCHERDKYESKLCTGDAKTYGLEINSLARILSIISMLCTALADAHILSRIDKTSADYDWRDYAAMAVSSLGMLIHIIDENIKSSNIHERIKISNLTKTEHMRAKIRMLERQLPQHSGELDSGRRSVHTLSS